jgi:FG-GAP-like repeat
VDDSLLQSFVVFNSAFRGGVFVGAGDVNGDGAADIVVGAGAGMSPQVATFNPVTGAISRSFTAYAANFTGGVRVAVHDADGDGHADIVTGPGQGGGPHVRLFNGETEQDMHDLMAFDAGFRGGVFVG